MSELQGSTGETRVGWGAGWTANMGNMESLKLNAYIETTARPGEKASECADRVYELVEAKLMEKVYDLKKSLEETIAQATKDAKHGGSHK